MTSTFALHQLYIIRNQVELVIASLEANGQVQPLAQDGPPPCQHPQEKRKASHNMGEEPQFICFACGATVQGVA